MRISKLQLSLGILIVVVGCVSLFYLVPSSNSSDSASKSTTQESSTDYMANQFKKIESAAKNKNVVVVTYDTKASYSKTFIAMVKSTAKKYPDTKVLYIKNNDGNFVKYYSESQNQSVTEMGKISNTNIFILPKNKTIDNVISPHYLDQTQIDRLSLTSTPGELPIVSNASIFLSGDANKDNIYLLENINSDPDAKNLIQTGVIDFAFNYFHLQHDN
ncbi:hypothetical protein HAU32_08460 [Weissella confusa]|uniref:Uncharacterized protein n=1 Tax=Weissella fermenti TaxID=2987699 RepID=A0ABT6D7V6_9LACO|nr:MULTISPECIES: hypothetical protein [Weissella]MBJ7689003.1 hypothetical protein [Weissella confusa]MCW0928025.1 hypothetical protein [Weissella sp. LMG 11983]MDF9300615.1 hypothetical protein [Weissella sp. BK2]